MSDRPVYWLAAGYTLTVRTPYGDAIVRAESRSVRVEVEPAEGATRGRAHSLELHPGQRPPKVRHEHPLGNDHDGVFVSHLHTFPEPDHNHPSSAFGAMRPVRTKAEPAEASAR